MKYVFGGNIFDAAESILTLNPSSGNFSYIWSIISYLYDSVCVPIGMGLVLIYFTVNIIEKSTQQQNIDIEHVIKLLMKLFLGLYFVEHGLEILGSIYSLGLSFVSDILGTLKHNITFSQKLTAWAMLTGEEWSGVSWGVNDIGKAMATLIVTFIMFLLSWIMTAIVTCICYFRMIEFYVRTALAPIALSDFFTEGVHGNGWRFIKSYIAVALQGGVIMLILVVYNALGAAVAPELDGVYTDIIDGGWDFIKYGLNLIVYLGEMLALSIAAIGLMIKSLSLTKEIVGVN